MTMRPMRPAAMLWGGLAMLLLGTAAIGPASPARAEASGPWCQLDDSWIPVNCSFTRFEQCRATTAGLNALCQRNPAFEPAQPRRDAAPPPPRPRKSRG